MNKRGIAPLVATLLLISFAVALGIVIMNFGQAQVELEAQCPIEIGLHLSEIGGQKVACYNVATQQIMFTIENGVNINIEGSIINVIGTLKAESTELNNAKIGKAGTYMGSVAYNFASGGAIRQVKITPKIKLYDKEQICVEKALIVENIRNC